VSSESRSERGEEVKGRDGVEMGGGQGLGIGIANGDASGGGDGIETLLLREGCSESRKSMSNVCEVEAPLVDEEEEEEVEACVINENDNEAAVNIDFDIESDLTNPLDDRETANISKTDGATSGGTTLSLDTVLRGNNDNYTIEEERAPGQPSLPKPEPEQDTQPLSSSPVANLYNEIQRTHSNASIASASTNTDHEDEDEDGDVDVDESEDEEAELGRSSKAASAAPGISELRRSPSETVMSWFSTASVVSAVRLFLDWGVFDAIPLLSSSSPSSSLSSLSSSLSGNNIRGVDMKDYGVREETEDKDGEKEDGISLPELAGVIHVEESLLGKMNLSFSLSLSISFNPIYSV
jgi:hypothetical protein